MYFFPKSNVAYIHIPKCGGTSVKKLMMSSEQYDNNDYILNQRKYMDDGVKLDLSHLTLFQIRHYFPEIFSSISSMKKMTIIRDPRVRIYSSIYQSIRMYGDRTLLERPDKAALIKNVYKLLDTVDVALSSRDALPYPMVHFSKQLDFIFLDNKQFVENIFHIENERRIINWINLNMDTSFDRLPRENSAVQPPNHIIKSARFASRLLPNPLKRFAKFHLGLSLNIIEDRFKKPFEIKEFFKNDDRILDFVMAHYQDDIEFYLAGRFSE